MLQPGLFLHVRRLPAVTAQWWCGTSRSRYVSVAALYTFMQQSVFTCTPSVCVIWSADLLVCPGRLGWPAGFCCRRPTTSPMPSLCVGWHGSPLQPRFVTRATSSEETHWLITMIQTTGNNLEVTGVFYVSAHSFWLFPWRRRFTCTSETPGITSALCLMISWLRWAPSGLSGTFIVRLSWILVWAAWWCSG